MIWMDKSLAIADKALAEIKLMGAIARKRVKLVAEFDNRSKGQRRRFAAVKQGD